MRSRFLKLGSVVAVWTILGISSLYAVGNLDAISDTLLKLTLQRIAKLEKELAAAKDKKRVAYLSESIGTLRCFAFRLVVDPDDEDSSRSITTESPHPRIRRGVKFDPAVTTAQFSEPRSIIDAFAPPPGSPGAEAVEQLRILNDARQRLLPNGSLTGKPPTVDFLNAEDLSELHQIDLQQGLSEAFFEPQDMASTLDGARLVVAARGSDRTVFPTSAVPPHLAVIDAAAGQLEKRIQLDESFWPVSLVISPDARTAYVSTSVLGPAGLTGEQMVLLVDLQSNAVTGRVNLPPGGRSGEIVMTPDGALLFVLANLDSPFLYAIDTRTQTVIAQIGGLPGQSPSRRALREATEIAIDPYGNKVYVADAAAPQSENDFETVGLAIVDVASATVTGLVPLPGVRRRGSGDDLQVTTDAIIHLDGVRGLVTFIDALSLEVIEQTDVGDALFEGAISRSH
jgi:YVTN family beta-propeller protein